MSSRWEADFGGHRFTVARGGKILQVECDGHLVSEKSWSLSGPDEVKGYIRLDGRKANVEVSVEAECTMKIDGKPVPTRAIK